MYISLLSAVHTLVVAWISEIFIWIKRQQQKKRREEEKKFYILKISATHEQNIVRFAGVHIATTHDSYQFGLSLHVLPCSLDYDSFILMWRIHGRIPTESNILRQEKNEIKIISLNVGSIQILRSIIHSIGQLQKKWTRLQFNLMMRDYLKWMKNQSKKSLITFNWPQINWNAIGFLFETGAPNEPIS
jgi:hypothetical protein